MMRRGIPIFSWSAVLLLAVATAAVATPAPNGATIETRTFNDCPVSTITTVNNYPSSISITDVMNPLCVGFANLHSWTFSADGGSTPAVFNSNSNFRFAADFVISGAGEGEGWPAHLALVREVRRRPVHGQCHQRRDRLLRRDAPVLQLHRQSWHYVREGHHHPHGDELSRQRPDLREPGVHPVPLGLQRQHLRQPGPAVR